MDVSEHPILIFDGACGTNIQAMNLPAEAWGGQDGCNEFLNIQAPEAVVALHKSFLDAGSMVVESNTFGASSLVLAEYGLQDRAEEIIHAGVACARRAIDGQADRYVAGSMGPGTKLPSLGHIDVETLADAYRIQARSLLEGGVDLLLLETCQDPLQIKRSLIACFDAVEETGKDVPVMVSVTVEQTGTLLVGADVAAVAAMLEPFPLFSLGLNCATGPDAMESHLRWLAHNWSKRVSCMPNQGLPEVVDGQTVYPLQPDEYARRMHGFVAQFGVDVVGGCCGTSPEHIRALVQALENVQPAAREVST